MAFDYKRDTKNHYKAVGVASKYHAAFTGALKPSTLAFRAVAAGERNTVARYLRQIRAKRIIDLPCGTGKLAPVFAHLGCNVIAADVSAEMLDLAKETFDNSGCKHVSFIQCDAERASSDITEIADAVVSLRLMHRVPSPVRSRMLSEFARLAPHAVISYGIETTYHRLRRVTRAYLLGGDSTALCFAALDDAITELEDSFRVVAHTWVLPFFSQERLFLLESRRFGR
jgi:ubiquinone/menaquinone biosynthesis C-methylase UbiE